MGCSFLRSWTLLEIAHAVSRITVPQESEDLTTLLKGSFCLLDYVVSVEGESEEAVRTFGIPDEIFRLGLIVVGRY